MFQGERAYVGPTYVTLDMTTRCNNVCLGCLYHCSQPRKTSPDKRTVRDLPLEVVQSLAPEMARMGTREAVLSGEGEPLLHPQFCQIVRSLKQAGLVVRSFSNGAIIDEAMAERVVESGLDELKVTFWAVSRAEHLKWHPGVNPDFLERRKRGIQFIQRARREAAQSSPRVRLQIPLNRSNFTNILGRVRLIVESGCESVAFGAFRDYGGPFESECLSRADCENLRSDMQRAGEELERAGIAHNIGTYLERAQLGGDAWRSFPCYAGWFEAYIKNDGSVLACCRCRMVMGDLTQQCFPEIWNAPAYRDFRRRASDIRQLARMGQGQECNCANCAQWYDNRKVHRVWRWLAPLKPSRRAAAV